MFLLILSFLKTKEGFEDGNQDIEGHKNQYR